MSTNVLPLHEVADASELSSVCQDKTFFVKTNIQLRKNRQFLEAAVIFSALELKLKYRY